ncbi:MAG: class I poly(R)-hydroxyalkanoic acid synthase [Proteobacteria bacterium]|nr:class I poly(R)-hydroxyalkanoic acid synthase [Pseudomonadota bacterium]
MEYDTVLQDPVALARVLTETAERIRPLLVEYFEKYGHSALEMMKDPLNLRPAYTEFLKQLYSDPQRVAQLQMQWWSEWSNLLQDSAARFISGKGEDIYKPDPGDRRFKSPAWEESAYFDFIKQSYLMTGRWMQDMVRNTEGMDDNARKKVEFYTRQMIDAMAPTNFLLTNPDVLKETLESNGENLVRGMKNLLEDMERGHGELKISTTDDEAFKPGVNLAVTPGKVVYQNDLMQLIQYDAATEKVFEKPLLIIPPWINKFYILDLRPDNSFIKWLTQQGHTVFTISWVNPGRRLAQKRFEDYMEEGVLDAMLQIRKITGEPQCNLAGYCLGGTLLSVTLAYLAAEGAADYVSSATFLTSLIDFKESGDLKMFMDEAQLKLLSKEMAEKGFLPASYLRKTFSMLRSGDLIWSFVVNNYLLGREPFPFDLLYWNDDSTNMPAAMHSFYMRKCYGKNLLPIPGGVTMNDTPIDMRKVKTPSYFLSTKEDHIAPWKATYAGTQMFRGPVHFTLAASGHVAGVINPPAAKKYCYWTGGEYPPSPEKWLGGARSHEGSWWPHWHEWARQYAGEQTVPARKPGGGVLDPIGDAPGSYVLMKAED